MNGPRTLPPSLPPSPSHQVYLARLKGSQQKVVVKVQRPGLKELFDIDLKNIRALAVWLQKVRYGCGTAAVQCSADALCRGRGMGQGGGREGGKVGAWGQARSGGGGWLCGRPGGLAGWQAGSGSGSSWAEGGVHAAGGHTALMCMG